MAGPAITVKIDGDTKGLSSDLDKSGAQVTAFGKQIDVGGIAKVAAFASVAGVAAVALLDMANAAAADRDEQAALQTALEAVGAATGDWAAQVDLAIAKGQELAFTDTDIRTALTSLVPVMGSVADAQGALSLAEDIARLKKVDLATAAQAVAKAEGGQATALAKLVGVNAKGLSATEVLAEAQRRAAGQAKTYGESTAGAAERNGIAMAELGEKIGALLLPVLDALLPLLSVLIDALSEVADAVLPVLIPWIRTLADVLAVVFRIIAKVAGAIADLIGWLADAISTVGEFVASLGPVQAIGDLLGDLFGPGFGGELGGPAGGATAGPGAPGHTIYVTATSADPEAVVRALERWTAHNGGYPALTRRLART